MIRGRVADRSDCPEGATTAGIWQRIAGSCSGGKSGKDDSLPYAVTKNCSRGGVPMRGLIAAIAFFVLAGASNGPNDVKKEMTQLEGEWSMVSGESNGQSLPKEAVKGGKRLAKDGETTIMLGGQVYFKAKFSIDPTKKPKA